MHSHRYGIVSYRARPDGDKTPLHSNKKHFVNRFGVIYRPNE